MNKLWYVIFGLVAVIVLLILLQPKPDNSKESALRDSLWVKEKRIRQLTWLNKELQKDMLQDSIKASESEAKFRASSTADKREIASLRANPKVVEVLKDNPSVDSLVREQEALIVKQDQYIDTLQQNFKELQVNVNKLTDNFNETLKLERERFDAQELLSKEYKQQNRKLRRGNKLLKVAGLVGTVGAFILGSQ